MDTRPFLHPSHSGPPNTKAQLHQLSRNTAAVCVQTEMHTLQPKAFRKYVNNREMTTETTKQAPKCRNAKREASDQGRG